jgi:hypothetical protein
MQRYPMLQTLNRRMIFTQPLDTSCYCVSNALVRRSERLKHTVIDAFENKLSQRLDRLPQRAVDAYIFFLSNEMPASGEGQFILVARKRIPPPRPLGRRSSLNEAWYERTLVFNLHIEASSV